MEEKEEFLRDDMLTHLTKDIGYKPSSDFTEGIMEKVNPPAKKSFLPSATQWSWQQVLMIALPLLTAMFFTALTFLEGGVSLSSSVIGGLFGEIADNQAFLISCAIGFSAVLYFVLNQLLVNKRSAA